MNTKTFIVFPHQLFANTSVLHHYTKVLLVEEWLYFHQFKFHKQKLLFHRLSMLQYSKKLQSLGLDVTFIPASSELCDVRMLLTQLAAEGMSEIGIYDPTDNWLRKRIEKTATLMNIKIHEYETLLFLNSKEDVTKHFSGLNRFHHAHFYKEQRRKFNILLEPHGEPMGGKWSFDEDNRIKYPKGKDAPVVSFPTITELYYNVKQSIEHEFPENYGEISDLIIYPTSHLEAEQWLEEFLEIRFRDFGIYEDAIVAHKSILNHSVISPLLNVGLLSPQIVIDKVMSCYSNGMIPLNSAEGFIRQVIGWREYIRGIYEVKGSYQRSKNFWGFSKKLPKEFWDGSTGITPVDTTIHKLLLTGYNHHIERLMILGNTMLLMEIAPDEVYQWFMTMYIDAYDWVMVPNIYGMSQFADGGLMSTKPYIGASNYILKMSDYKRGEWCEMMDSLFWTFMDKHRDVLSKNVRMAMLLKAYDKKKENQKEKE